MEQVDAHAIVPSDSRPSELPAGPGPDTMIIDTMPPSAVSAEASAAFESECVMIDASTPRQPEGLANTPDNGTKSTRREVKRREKRPREEMENLPTPKRRRMSVEEKEAVKAQREAERLRKKEEQEAEKARKREEREREREELRKKKEEEKQQEKQKKEEEKRKREEEREAEKQRKLAEKEAQKKMKEEEREAERKRKEEEKETEKKRKEEEKEAERKRKEEERLKGLKGVPALESFFAIKKGPAEATVEPAESQSFYHSVGQFKAEIPPPGAVLVTFERPSLIDRAAFESTLASQSDNDEDLLFGLIAHWRSQSKPLLSGLSLERNERRRKACETLIDLSGTTDAMANRVQRLLLEARYKCLTHHDDMRPTYWGTWTRKAQRVCARRPWAIEDVLDYEEDSAEDWEEGAGSVDDLENSSLCEGDGGLDEYELSDDSMVVPDDYLSADEGLDADEGGVALNRDKLLARTKASLKAKARQPLKPKVFGLVWDLESAEGDSKALLERASAVMLAEGPFDLATAQPWAPMSAAHKTEKSRQKAMQTLSDDQQRELVRMGHGAISASRIGEQFSLLHADLGVTAKRITAALKALCAYEIRQSVGTRKAFYATTETIARLGLDASALDELARQLPEHKTALKLPNPAHPENQQSVPSTVIASPTPAPQTLSSPKTPPTRRITPVLLSSPQAAAQGST